MPVLSPAQVILIGLIVAPAIFILCAYFTRANLRRTASALAGVIIFMIVQYSWDRLAGVTGWWSYPAYGTDSSLPMSPAIYLFSGLVYAGVGLIGWRIARRYGSIGTLIFLIAWSLWGFIHDTAGSALFASSRFMVIGPGVVPGMMDFLVYLTGMASVLLTMWLIGGPFQADTLARMKKTAAIREENG